MEGKNKVVYLELTQSKSFPQLLVKAVNYFMSHLASQSTSESTLLKFY